MFYMSNSETNNANNNSKERKTAAEVINELSNIGDQSPGETIIRSEGVFPSEHIIRAAPERTRDNSINFIRKSNVDPNKTANEQKVQYNNLVRMVADRMRNGGSGVVPEFPTDMTAQAIGEIYAQAQEYLKQEQASMEDEQAARREEFRRRLVASRPVCEACGLQLSSWRTESEDEHKEKCGAYQS